jgi:hypothetical protein
MKHPDEARLRVFDLVAEAKPAAGKPYMKKPSPI